MTVAHDMSNLATMDSPHKFLAWWEELNECLACRGQPEAGHIDARAWFERGRRPQSACIGIEDERRRVAR